MTDFKHPVFPAFLDYYGAILQWTDPSAVNFGKAEPVKKYVGMLAYSDNVNWVAGVSAGYYRWNGAAWIFVG